MAIPPAPSAPPLPPSDYRLLGPPSKTPSNNLCGPQAQTLSREKEEVKDAVQKEIDAKMYELSDDLARLELEDGLANLLGQEAEDILDE